MAKAPKTPAAPQADEHPLMRHARLRELYTRMLQAGLLEDRLRLMQKKAPPSRRLPLWSGEEAVRVAAAIDLQPGDRLSDDANSLCTSFLAGASLDALLVHAASVIAAPVRLVRQAEAAFLKDPVALPAPKSTFARLHLAAGAAALLQSAKPPHPAGQSNVVIAFAHVSSLSLTEWKQLLDTAGRHEFPMLFVVLPDRAAPRRAPLGRLSALSTSCRVPGIPVDAADAIALYRVAQESLLRARARGGPALLEAVAVPRLGTSDGQPPDALASLRAYLLGKAISTPAALARAEVAFAARLDRVML